MHIGGVQKALVNLLWNIRGQYDITLLLFHCGGQLLRELPPEIQVVTPASAYRYLGMTRNDRLSGWDKLCRSFYAAITRLLGRKYAIALMALGQKKFSGYDAAISYFHNGASKAFYGGCNDFVLRHVTARKKITFLHGDYQLCGANTPENTKQYAQFDTIAACSQGCADSLLQVHPEMADRVEVVPNCHRFEDIVAKAAQTPVTLTEDKINLVTVARLGREKGVERAVHAIAGLGAAKEKLHFYVIGDGILKPLLQQIIQEKNLEDQVTLCGMLENPYGYIRAADLLLIPSYSEAAPLVIGEAASLGTPVLSTKTSSAEEMIRQKNLGWVCENTQEGIQKGLQALLDAPHILQDKKSEITQYKMDNTAAVRQFKQIIEK